MKNFCLAAAMEVLGRARREDGLRGAYRNFTAADWRRKALI